MRRAFAIARATFRESVRSKILYTIFVFALLLVLASAFFGTVSIGSQIVVIKNFGIFSISVFSIAFACISGSTLLSKEVQRHTIFTVLSRPLRRWEFILGKYLGMLLTVTVLIAIMGGSLSLLAAVIDGQPPSILLDAYLGVWFEAIIVCAAVIFFSSIVVTPLLSGLLSFGIFLTGRSSEYILWFVRQGKLGASASRVLEGLYAVVPHLNFFDSTNSIVYGISPPEGYIYWAFVYSIGYAGILLCLAVVIFGRREFNK